MDQKFKTRKVSTIPRITFLGTLVIQESPLIYSILSI